MAEEIKKYLHKVMAGIEGLYAIVITDRDGVPVLKASTEKAPDQAMRPGFMATVGMATDQAGKLGLGKSKKIMCMYGNYQVVHFNSKPLMVSIIASSSANSGMLLNLEGCLMNLVQRLKESVDVA